jgi:Flp pilus assembly protein TadG
MIVESTGGARPRRVRQGGAAAIEFALVFPVLFMVTYGAIIYAYIYVLRQSLTFAAQEAAQAAVSVQPGASGYDDLVKQTAVNTATAAIAWMPANVRTAIGVNVSDVTICRGPSTGACASLAADDVAVVVRLELPLASGDEGEGRRDISPLFATITLPPFGRFPPLPNMMAGQAVARL